MKIRQQLISALVLSTLSVPVLAERLISAEPYQNDYITVTGFLGSRLDIDVDQGTGENDPGDGFHFSQAIALNWNYKENSEGELLFSNSLRTDGDQNIYVQYLHVGGRILFTNTTPFSTSIALGVGGTYINPQGDTYESNFAFSASMAAGIRYQFTDQFAFRSDLRVYGTLLREGHSESFCSGDDCSDGYLIEAELLTGLEYKF
ncbi:outer membrane beta-barrel protein [Psychromonas sp. SP041]|uniref:outer membrane beta-barrel protein n=1 Tax=Psychromonas sp. SP041 TaxID=1365007 RepID=UPI000423CD75|nr:outer membrane beta-barrel protein [Psychromonas sp. SP041]